MCGDRSQSLESKAGCIVHSGRGEVSVGPIEYRDRISIDYDVDAPYSDEIDTAHGLPEVCSGRFLEG